MAATPQPPAADAPRRPVKKWIVLLFVWTIGLAFWAGYLGLAILILFRLFGDYDPTAGSGK